MGLKEQSSSILPGSGVDLDHFKPSDEEGSNHFIMISRLLPEKGVLHYVEAANTSKKNIESMKFKLLGMIDKSPNKLLI